MTRTVQLDFPIKPEIRAVDSQSDLRIFVIVMIIFVVIVVMAIMIMKCFYFE